MVLLICLCVWVCVRLWVLLRVCVLCLRSIQTKIFGNDADGGVWCVVSVVWWLWRASVFFFFLTITDAVRLCAYTIIYTTKEKHHFLNRWKLYRTNDLIPPKTVLLSIQIKKNHQIWERKSAQNKNKIDLQLFFFVFFLFSLCCIQYSVWLFFICLLYFSLSLVMFCRFYYFSTVSVLVWYFVGFGNVW